MPVQLSACKPWVHQLCDHIQCVNTENKSRSGRNACVVAMLPSPCGWLWSMQGHQWTVCVHMAPFNTLRTGRQRQMDIFASPTRPPLPLVSLVVARTLWQTGQTCQPLQQQPHMWCRQPASSCASQGHAAHSHTNILTCKLYDSLQLRVWGIAQYTSMPTAVRFK
jgi:hypothetical protein